MTSWDSPCRRGGHGFRSGRRVVTSLTSRPFPPLNPLCRIARVARQEEEGKAVYHGSKARIDLSDARKWRQVARTGFTVFNMESGSGQGDATDMHKGRVRVMTSLFGSIRCAMISLLSCIQPSSVAMSLLSFLFCCLRPRSIPSSVCFYFDFSHHISNLSANSKNLMKILGLSLPLMMSRP